MNTDSILFRSNRDIFECWRINGRSSSFFQHASYPENTIPKKLTLKEDPLEEERGSDRDPRDSIDLSDLLSYMIMKEKCQ